MKMLIIGGNRFFGRKLARRLLESGNSVTLLNRQNIDDGFGNKIQRIKCDRKDEAALKKSVKDFKWDIVYDQVCFEAPDAEAACRIFTGLTPRYVFTSSLSVYGPGEALSESAFDPLKYKFTSVADAKTQYAEAKRQCEAVFYSQTAFEVVSVRFPFVLGTDDYTNRLKWHVRRASRGESIFIPNPEAKVSFIDSDEAASVLGTLASKNFSGPLNVGSKDPVSLKSLIGLVEVALGKKVELAKNSDESNFSPYGIENDWYMDISKLEALGITVSDTGQWLPGLVSYIAKEVQIEQF